MGPKNHYTGLVFVLTARAGPNEKCPQMRALLLWKKAEAA